MNKENLKDELKPFYEKGDCCSWIVELRKDKYQLQQENKQLKEEIENIKDFNNKLQASKDRLDKDDYNLAHILTELEEDIPKIINENIEHYEGARFLKGGFTINQECIKNRILDKIQELRNKYE